MADDKKQPIVVKKVKKAGHGHHGGAWKVAYADFVTAMMAFFLLMWLLGSTSGEQRDAISDFFQNPSAIQGPGGASTSMIKLGGSMDLSRGDQRMKIQKPSKGESNIKYVAEEKRRLDQLLEDLKAAIEQSQALKPFKDQLLLDITPEGLRLQIIDKENRPMFALGSDQLQPYTRKILHEVSKTINSGPNRISITGHTDATPYSSAKRKDYSNWELSTDRANAARRELLIGGMQDEKIGRVIGLGSSVLFNKLDPFSPVNRRISIIVMNRATEQAVGLPDRTEEDEPKTINEPVIAKPSVKNAVQKDAESKTDAEVGFTPIR